MSEPESSWLVPLANTSSDRTLYVFPPGGSGAAAVRALAQEVPDWLRVVAVRLPGRESLAHLDPLFDVDVIAATLADQIVTDSRDHPSVLFYGHCAGAIVGYEVAALMPPGVIEALVVSSHESPDRIPVSLAWTWSDDDFLARVAQDGFLPKEILDDAELRELILPALRADYEAVETHVSLLDLLECKIVALRSEDESVVSEADMRAWAARSTGDFALVVVPGGHNMIKDQPQTVARIIEHNAMGEL